MVANVAVTFRVWVGFNDGALDLLIETSITSEGGSEKSS